MLWQGQWAVRGGWYGRGAMWALVLLLVLVWVVVLTPGTAYASITLTGASPNAASVGETVDVTLTGTGFASGMAARITRSNGDLIVAGTEVSVVDSTYATFRFVIPANAPVGTNHRLTVVQDTYTAHYDPFIIRSVIKSITFNGDEVLGTSIYTSPHNTLEIVVEANSSSAEVKFGTLVTIGPDGTVTTRQTGLGDGTGKSGAFYTVERYPLRAGSNSITITATLGSRKETVRFTVNYPNAPTLNAEHYIGDIRGQSRIEAFGKAITMEPGKDNYLTNAAGAFTSKQGVIITALGTPANRPGGFVAVSPLFYLRAEESTTYRLGVPGRLTLQYSGLGAVPQKLTVWRADNAAFNSGLVNLGGLVNQRTNTITIPIEGAFSGYYAVFSGVIGAENYTDLPEDGWYYHAVSALRAKGVMESANSGNNPWGYGGLGGATTFGLSSDLNIRRGEFAYMITRALGLTLVDLPGGGEGTTVFGDVNGSPLTRHYRQAIETAARNGLIYGFPDGTFGWNQTLTRQQAAAIIARAARLTLDTSESSVNTGLARIYNDYEDIAPWARSSVLACSRAGVMGGFPDGTFKAGDNLTRAQAASLIHRFMERQKLI